MTDHTPPTVPAYLMRDVNKYYGKFRALNGIDLTLGEGKIIGLLGKNGAGKSTLMRCMLGFLSFTGDINLGSRPIKHRDK